MADLGAVKDDDFLDEGGTSPDVATDDETPASPPSEPPAEPSPPEPEDKGTEPGAAPTNPAENAPEGYVPHQALHQQRELTKQVQTQLEQSNQTNASLRGMFDQLRDELKQSREANKPAEPTVDDQLGPRPNQEEDPIAALQWDNRKMSLEMESMKAAKTQETEATEQATQQQEQLKQFMGAVRNKVMEFEKDTPDYGNAYMYAQQKRMAEYDALGVNPAQKEEMFFREVMQVAATAMQNGINPGQAMYNLATSWGYTKDPGKPPANNEPKGETIEEQMARLEKGNQAGGMGNPGGASPETPISINDIDGMSDSEFDAWWDKQTGGNSIL